MKRVRNNEDESSSTNTNSSSSNSDANKNKFQYSEYQLKMLSIWLKSGYIPAIEQCDDCERFIVSQSKDFLKFTPCCNLIKCGDCWDDNDNKNKCKSCLKDDP